MGLIQSFNLPLFLTQILLAIWIVSNKMEFKLILMNLILDCRYLLGQPWKVTIRHILREANLLTLYFGTLWTSLLPRLIIKLCFKHIFDIDLVLTLPATFS